MFVIQVPASEDEWRKVANEFQSKWNYAGCFGAIDGKHVAVKQSADTGSEFFNYKQFFNVLFVAHAYANYKFLYVNVGAVVDREPRTVIHVKRAKRFDPMG